MNGQPPNICVYLPTLRVSWRFVSGGLKIASGPPNNAFKPNSFRYTNNMAKEACRSEEHTSELQSLMRISYAVFCLKKKITLNTQHKLIQIITCNPTDTTESKH